MKQGSNPQPLGTPATLSEAIHNGLMFGPLSEAATEVERHVRDFLAQKFSVFTMNADERVAFAALDLFKAVTGWESGAVRTRDAAVEGFLMLEKERWTIRYGAGWRDELADRAVIEVKVGPCWIRTRLMSKDGVVGSGVRGIAIYEGQPARKALDTSEEP